ncbi:hypothetical protein Btru_033319 [Bulinus truncatus]|nr:hypothetical protein Btru_033319 [Bulinus truncatus]
MRKRLKQMFSNCACEVSLRMRKRLKQMFSNCACEVSLRMRKRLKQMFSNYACEVSLRMRLLSLRSYISIMGQVYNAPYFFPAIDNSVMAMEAPLEIQVCRESLTGCLILRPVRSDLTKFHKFNVSSQVYWLSNYTASYTLAASHCSTNGGEMTFFESNTEYFNVLLYLKNKFPSNGDIWVKISAKDTKSNGYYDLFSWGNEVFWTNVWGNADPNENCVKTGQVCCARMMLFDMTLRDKPGDAAFYFLCTPVNECEVRKGNCSHICTDLEQGYACSCQTGYTLSKDLINCNDEDECSRVSSPCSRMCNNTVGSYACDCYAGFKMSSDGNCTDIDECSTGDSACQQTCNNTQGSYVCGCEAGHVIGNDSRNCTDVDECSEFSSHCQMLCINTDGSYICGCEKGYALASDGRTCNDTDECALRNGLCQQNCVNTIGSFACSCRDGYVIQMDDRTCLDVDECKENLTDCNGACVNTDGGFICECPSGYSLNLTNFVDINECQQPSDHSCSQRCNNTPGSYTCFCDVGYYLADDRSTCNQKDYCLTAPHACQHGCIDTNSSSYRCVCNSGYYLDVGDHSTCVDIDECVQHGKSPCEHFCRNTPGSYQCACQQGFTLADDGHSCVVKRSHNYCPCSCATYNLSHFEAARKEILTQLKLETKNLSSYRRQRSSKSDHRPISITIGSCGMIFVTSVLGLLVIPDLLKIVKVILDYRSLKLSVSS